MKKISMVLIFGFLVLRKVMKSEQSFKIKLLRSINKYFIPYRDSIVKLNMRYGINIWIVHNHLWYVYIVQFGACLPEDLINWLLRSKNKIWSAIMRNLNSTIVHILSSLVNYFLFFLKYTKLIRKIEIMFKECLYLFISIFIFANAQWSYENISIFLQTF